MKNLIANFLNDESGAAADAFGVFAAGVSFALVALVAVANGVGANGQMSLAQYSYLGNAPFSPI